MPFRILLALFLTSLAAYAQSSPDNAGVYSTKELPPLKPLLSSLAPKAKVTEGKEGDSSTFTVEWPDLSIQITVDPTWDRDVQLSGMKGWISRFPDDEKGTPAVAGLLKKMGSTVACVGNVITPGYDAEGKASALVLGLASKLEGFVFSHQSFYDTTGAKIIGLPEDPASIQKPGTSKAGHEERKAMIKEREAAEPSKEAKERKQRSIDQLKKEGVPVIEHLPVIEDSAEAKKRTTEEIAQRTIAVILAAVKGEGLDQETVDSLVKKYGAEKFFTPEEAAFIKSAPPTQQDRIKFSWRYECAWVLLWSLGYVESLPKPEGICDVPKLVGIIKDRDTAQFIKEAKLRPLDQILDQADLIYRYHWATTDARVKGQPAPAQLEGGVVQERHHALNWLIGYMDQAWDDISTDT